VKGVFLDGVFHPCGEWSPQRPNTVPRCIGRATADGEHYREDGDARCTCPTFTPDEARLAREQKLTIKDVLPDEWRVRRRRVIRSRARRASA
jgi:hypothetical protein